MAITTPDEGVPPYFNRVQSARGHASLPVGKPYLPSLRL